MDNIKLTADPRDLSDEIHGYYRTAEGREFLRYLYGRYRKRREHQGEDATFGYKKMAMIIADDSYLDQPKEIRLTAAALRRWAERGQRDLWLKDAARMLRAMRKLEAELVAIPEIAQISDDRAASIHKYDFANALSSFFYGHTSGQIMSRIQKRLREAEGVYEFAPAPGAALVFPVVDRTLFRLATDENFPFLLVQEITVSVDPEQNLSGGETRRSGFAFIPRPFKGIVRFMVSQRNPKARWLEFFAPRGSEDWRDDGGPPQHGETTYLTYTSFFDESIAYRGPSTTGDSQFVVIRRVTGDVARFVDNRFSGNMWDIPL